MKNNMHNLVFIVEDNEIYSLMLDYALSLESNCRFMSFKSGEECVENLHMKPVLIIMDYGLPGMNGFETLRVIKKTEPGLPIVMLTDNHDLNIAKKFLKEGVYDYVLKGKGSAQEILKIINTILYGTKFTETQRAGMLGNRYVVGFVMLALSAIAWYLFGFG